MLSRRRCRPPRRRASAAASWCSGSCQKQNSESVSAWRRKARILDETDGAVVESGPWVQVSRLGNPLFNEVVVPMKEKDLWNSLPPDADDQFAKYVKHPELAKLLPVLYPGVFPNLAGLTAVRDDLEAILLTGIPSGIIDGFQNFTGPMPADLLRLNMAIPPSSSPNIFGILGGDLAGYPNGRRVADDVVTIELRAIAGLTYQVVHGSSVYTADDAAGAETHKQDLVWTPLATTETTRTSTTSSAQTPS